MCRKHVGHVGMEGQSRHPTSRAAYTVKEMQWYTWEEVGRREAG